MVDYRSHISLTLSGKTMLLKRILPVIALIFVAFVGRGFACSCMMNGTVDEEFARTPNVVILRLQSVHKAGEGEETFGVGGIKSAKLVVERSFKGTLKPGQELTFAQGGGGDCVWTFAEDGIGSEFLFYLGAKPSQSGMWAGPTCSRSNLVKWAGADMLYLENVKDVIDKTRLSGHLIKQAASATTEIPWSSEILADREVTITGNGKTIKLKTDKNGVYEIYGLPPGKYVVRPEPIAGYKDNRYGETPGNTEVVIDAKKKHTERDFYFEIDSLISGKVSDALGKPLKDVCLKLVPASGTPRGHSSHFDCTEPDGSFAITEVPAGSYVLLFNYDDKITADAPFRSFYYPRTNKREEAALLQIEPGTKIKDLLINAPAAAEVITVTGVLKMSDGKTANEDNAEYASIEFVANSDEENVSEDDSPASRTTIDENGRFVIRILKGQKGKLFGTIGAYSGKYEDCPAFEKLISTEDGSGIYDIKTPAILIDAITDQTNIELVFPFPSCKKADID